MKSILCGLIRFYQQVLSPMLPKACRFYPSCSQYMIQAITERGVLRGVALGGWRILRCNPFTPGGYDPVPPGRHRRSEHCRPERPVRLSIAKTGPGQE